MIEVHYQSKVRVSFGRDCDADGRSVRKVAGVLYPRRLQHGRPVVIIALNQC